MALRDYEVPYNEAIVSNSIESILPRLFRAIRDSIGIPENKFNFLVDRYTSQVYPDLPVKKISSTRNNIRRDYLKSYMTWRVFIRAFRILNMKSVTFSVHARFAHPQLNEASASRRIVLDPKWKSNERDLTEADGMLHALYEDLQLASGMTTQRFNELFKIYAMHMHLPTNVKDMSSARGNLNKELKKKNMSWKNFIKGMVFLTASQLEIGLHVTRHDNVTMSTYLKIVLDPEVLNQIDTEESEE